MHLSSKQISLITLGTMASLSAYGATLVRSSAPPEPDADPSPFTDLKPSQPDLMTQVKSRRSPPRPETLEPHAMPPRVPVAAPRPAPVNPPPAAVGSRSRSPFKPSRFSPPAPPRSSSRPPIQLAALPIDQWVAESLQPTAPPTANAIAAKPQRPPVPARATGLPVAANPAPGKSIVPFGRVTPQPVPVKVTPSATLPAPAAPANSGTLVEPPPLATVAPRPRLNPSLVTAPPTALTPPAAIAKPEQFPSGSAVKPISPHRSVTALDREEGEPSPQAKPENSVPVQDSPTSQQLDQVLDHGSLHLSKQQLAVFANSDFYSTW